MADKIATNGKKVRRSRRFRKGKGNCNSKQKKRRRRGLDVSDHAIVRYIERVNGCDTERLKNEIITKIKPLVDKLGDGAYPVGDGFSAVVSKGIIVTIR